MARKGEIVSRNDFLNLNENGELEVKYSLVDSFPIVHEQVINFQKCY